MEIFKIFTRVHILLTQRVSINGFYHSYLFISAFLFMCLLSLYESLEKLPHHWTKQSALTWGQVRFKGAECSLCITHPGSQREHTRSGVRRAINIPAEQSSHFHLSYCHQCLHHSTSTHIHTHSDKHINTTYRSQMRPTETVFFLYFTSSFGMQLLDVFI